MNTPLPWLTLLLLLAVGCSRSPRKVKVPEPDPEPKATARGQDPAKESDKADKKKPKKGLAEPTPSRLEPVLTRTDEEGILGGRVIREGGEMGMAGVVVWLTDPPREKAPAPPRTVRLARREGRFVPAVQVARVGWTLELITTEDRADFVLAGKAARQVVLSRGETAAVPLPSAGLVTVRSELKPEAPPAVVHVFDHAFTAVTGPDGRFQLPKLPAGTYRLALLRPGSSETKTVAVTVEAGKGVSVRWTIPGRD
jgi:hypothetical protein